jgi:hypothetical protein
MNGVQLLGLLDPGFGGCGEFKLEARLSSIIDASGFFPLAVCRAWREMDPEFRTVT